MIEKENNIKTFSIVVAHYNQGNLWQIAVNSILKQDYPAIQIVFADDGSEDFDSNQVETYIKNNMRDNIVSVIVMANERNAGTVRNLNKARMLCTGQYIAHIAADDAYANENVLSAFAHALEKNDAFCGVYGKSFLCDERLNPTGEEYFTACAAAAMNEMTAFEQFECLTRRCCIPMGATAFLSSKLHQLGSFDERHIYYEDWPFFLRATRTGNRFLFVEMDALLYRAGGITRETGVSKYKAQCYREHMQVYDEEIWPYLAGWSRGKIAELYDFYNQVRMDMKNEAGGFETKSRWRIISRNPRLLPFLIKRWAKTSKKTLGILLLSCAAVVALQTTNLFFDRLFLNVAVVLVAVLFVVGLYHTANRFWTFLLYYFNKKS